MVHREYPNLVVGNAPAMDIEPLRGGRRKVGWLAAGSFALLLCAGVTATLVGSPAEPDQKKPAVTKTQPKADNTAVNLTDPELTPPTGNATPPSDP